MIPLRRYEFYDVSLERPHLFIRAERLVEIEVLAIEAFPRRAFRLGLFELKRAERKKPFFSLIGTFIRWEQIKSRTVILIHSPSWNWKKNYTILDLRSSTWILFLFVKSFLFIKSFKLLRQFEKYR